MPNIQVSDHFIQKLLFGRTDTRRTDCSTWTTKVVGEKKTTTLTSTTDVGLGHVNCLGGKDLLEF